MRTAVNVFIIAPKKLFWEVLARAFEENGLPVTMFCSPEAVPWPALGAGVAFLDADCLGAARICAIAELTSCARGAPVLVACDGERTGNAGIAAMLLAGADDVVFYNTDKAVLLAKARAHLRRLPAGAPAAQLRSRDGEIRLCRASRGVKLRRRGRVVELDTLTPREFDLLVLLLEKQEQALSRFDLLETIWGDKAGRMNSETVDRHMESLRRKLGSWGKKIKTLYGVGYVLKNGAGTRG
ncbi:MAG: response regulator transcription factor [Elusimicrobia bacterium]|nr:response regulator transcription factor [Elusimicrobiota bacterium]